ncbi:hypothetical protein M408DRAFT_326596 [Serendipita vermifera MAFF 305830]|uniref:Uncharacterized protein n=1 Tax=Serendipita vermifera MAFF 305830 TaxID=933852 RepID=A0A0C2XVG4_SERVB|nr:hypothetical protein M408DRAFT_326596 [Serendipita vermifera MAFF 305830]
MEITTEGGLNSSENDPSSFRRFKPLPKRRRTAALNVLRNDYDPAEMTSFSFQDPQALAALADLHAKPYFSQLNAQQAIRDLFTSDSTDPRLLADFTGLYTNPAVGPVMSAIPDSEEPLDSDYIDHLQLPANTKKRKVPGLNRAQLSAANAIGSMGHAAQGLTERGPDSPINEGALQLAAHRLLVDGPEDIDALNSTIHPIPQAPARKTHRDSLVTQARLRQKALISARKKQFAAALDEASTSDSLSLEQALLARYPQLDSLFDIKASTYLRNSRKLNSKQTKSKPLSTVQEKAPSSVPTCDFTFAYLSPASERAEATRLEAARLQAVFEEELARQAARAVEAAAKVAASMEPSPKNRKRVGGGARTSFPMPSRIDSDSLSGDQALLGKGRQKKKKRSALANASNPHHLRNYVPSRLPQQPNALGQASLAAANLLTPPPLRFLSAQIPPKRRRTGDTPVSDSMPLTAPIDEWICANCEYNLFYGDEAGFKRGVKSRKKILSRRRRARERAAAAASGIAPTIPDKHTHMEQTEMDASPNLDTNVFSDQVGTRPNRQISGADASDTLK